MSATLVRRFADALRGKAGGRGGLPPGPRQPAIVQTVMWAVAPVRFGKSCMRRYGPLFTARILGFGNVVYISTPDGIRHGTGLLVLTASGDRVCAMTRFENSVLPWFGLPRSLPG